MNLAERKLQQLREKYVAAERAYSDFTMTLRAKYGDVQWASDAESRKKDKLLAAVRKLETKIVDHVNAISPRSWSTGVPVWWIAAALSYADAITSGPLSVVPPPAYGYTEADMRRKAAAL